MLGEDPFVLRREGAQSIYERTVSNGYFRLSVSRLRKGEACTDSCGKEADPGSKATRVQTQDDSGFWLNHVRILPVPEPACPGVWRIIGSFVASANFTV